MTDIILFSFAKSSTELSALLISLMIKKKILIFLFLTRVWYTTTLIMTILMSLFFSINWKRRSWLRSTWVLCFYMSTDSMNWTDLMNWFTSFKFVSRFKMIVNVIIKFKFFRFISQISLDSDLWNAVDCLSLKQQISMFEYSMRILINRLQSLSKSDFFSIKDFQWLFCAVLDELSIKTSFHSYVFVSWSMYTERV
jgi:hypothetical protein